MNNLEAKEYTPLDSDLISAILSNDAQAALRLIAQGANPNARDGLTGLPALLLLLDWKEPDYIVPPENTIILEALLRAGSHIEATNNTSETALIIAAGTNKPATVRILLDYHANVNAWDNWGYTALIAAAQNGFTDIVTDLLDKGADIDAQTEYGVTALMRACSEENAGAILTIQALLDRNANAKLTTPHGDTALTIAEDNEYGKIIKLLRNNI